MQFEIEQEKEKLINILSEQYSQGLIAMAEYERLLDFVNKTETNKEIDYIRKIIDTNENYALRKKTADNKNNPVKQFFVMLKDLLPKKPNVRKIKSFSGNHEMRLYDIDFVENRLTLKINVFGGDVIIHISKNVSVENNVQTFGGNYIMNKAMDVNSSEVTNKLIIIGKTFGGNIHIVYEK